MCSVVECLVYKISRHFGNEEGYEVRLISHFYVLLTSFTGSWRRMKNNYYFVSQSVEWLLIWLISNLLMKEIIILVYDLVYKWVLVRVYHWQAIWFSYTNLIIMKLLFFPYSEWYAAKLYVHIFICSGIFNIWL